MAKKRSFKRALVMAILSMVVCLSMFAGTTFAWFTDSVTSSNNIIKAGNLDIELYYDNDETSDWTKVGANTNIFKKDALWEPGHTEVIKFKIANEGSLDLKYLLKVYVADETSSVNKAGESFKLSDFIKYAIVEGEVDYATRDEAIADVEAEAKTLSEKYEQEALALTSEEEKIVTMVVYMPTTVDNDANADIDVAPAPTINLGIMLNATQLSSENDSFDNTYDEGADFVVEVDSSAELMTALKAGGNIRLASNLELVEGESIVVPEGVTASLDMNGKTINGNYQAGSTTKHVYAIVNRGTLTLENGTVNARGISNYGNLTIESGAYNAIDTNGGASVWNYAGKLVINGGTFTAAEASKAPAACTVHVAENSSAEINGGKFICDADLTYAVISNDTLVVNGGEFISDHGVFSSINGSTLEINDGSFEVRGNGHVVYSGADKNIITLNGGTYYHSFEKASAHGDVIVYAVKPEEENSDVKVSVTGGNYKSVSAAFSYSGSNITITGGKFEKVATTVFQQTNNNGIEEFVASGYEATTNEDGSLTVNEMAIEVISITSENISTTNIQSNSYYSIEGDFNNSNVNITMEKGLENVVFDGSKATNIAELIITCDDEVINAPLSCINASREGKITIKNFTVNSQINVFATNTEVEISNNTAEALAVHAGNCTINICNNTFDAKTKTHTIYKNATDEWNASPNEYGVILTIFDYTLKFDNNTVTNATSHAVGINGYQTTLKDVNGLENKIESFTGNKITVNSTTKTERAAIKIWDDVVYAPNNSPSVANEAAQNFINTVKDSNTFTIGDGHYKFSIYDVRTNGEN